jgi:hypothetical protein
VFLLQASDGQPLNGVPVPVIMTVTVSFRQN